MTNIGFVVPFTKTRAKKIENKYKKTAFFAAILTKAGKLNYTVTCITGTLPSDKLRNVVLNMVYS